MKYTEKNNNKKINNNKVNTLSADSIKLYLSADNNNKIGSM